MSPARVCCKGQLASQDAGRVIIAVSQNGWPRGVGRGFARHCIALLRWRDLNGLPAPSLTECRARPHHSDHDCSQS